MMSCVPCRVYLARKARRECSSVSGGQTNLLSCIKSRVGDLITYMLPPNVNRSFSQNFSAE